MSSITVKYSCVLLLGVFISAISQVLLKKAAQKKYDSVIHESTGNICIYNFCGDNIHVHNCI